MFSDVSGHLLFTILLLTSDDSPPICEANYKAAAPILNLERKKNWPHNNLPLAKWWGSNILILNSRPRPIAAEDDSTWRSWEPVNGPFEFRIVFLLMRSLRLRTIDFFSNSLYSRQRITWRLPHLYKLFCEGRLLQLSVSIPLMTCLLY